MIRQAMLDDADAIMELVEKFYYNTDYAGFAPFDYETVFDLTKMLIETGVVLVGTIDEVIVGVIGLVVAPFMFNKSKLGAYEVIWYVEKAAMRLGIGGGLLAKIDEVCKDRGIELIQMVHLSNSPPQAAAMYVAMGYKHSESSYTKVL